MPTVAEQLRAAREARKLTIAEVAEATKIRTDHIRALEEGNYNAFSATIYIRGSVRNYATLLKLDTPRIMAALDEELHGTEKFSEPPPLVEESNTTLDQVMFLLSKFDWRKSVIGLAALGVILIAMMVTLLWRHHQRANPLAGLPPAVYQPAGSGETLPLPKR
ncbi:MAG: helix-turn-helix domain-containing protein [Verrucomicrobiota bacterium]|nr:helix-turn-helix domain-containing protein [Verrucomicrobiota bacterium]MDE3066058.1 helix-turn-helix domain-containing protein [Verrucomicrobiota bacterium]